MDSASQTWIGSHLFYTKTIRKIFIQMIPSLTKFYNYSTRDVRQLDKVISRDFVQIFKGDKCFEGTTIPEFLTLQRVLKIMTKHNQRALLRVSELLQEAGKNYEELKADVALYRRKNQIQRETR